MIERDIYHDGSLVVTKCSGLVTKDELVSSTYWMINNFNHFIKPGFNQLFDATDAITHGITDESIRHLAHINASSGQGRGDVSMAIVAKNPHTKALAGLHKMLSVAANIKVEVFNNANEAYKWLGVKNPVS